MRLPMLILAIGLAGCAGQSKTPGLRVADAALSSGSAELAVQITQNLISANPKDTGAMLSQARAQLMLGDKAGAAANYRRAVQTDPSLAEAKMGLGKLVMASEPATAERMFREVLAKDPRNTGALNDLGVACDLQGRHEEAQTIYRQVLGLSPELVSARQNLGLSLAVSGNPSAGAEMLGQVAGSSDLDRRARDNLAVALALTGRTGEANQVLREEMSQADATAHWTAIVNCPRAPCSSRPNADGRIASAVRPRRIGCHHAIRRVRHPVMRPAGKMMATRGLFPGSGAMSNCPPCACISRRASVRRGARCRRSPPTGPDTNPAGGGPTSRRPSITNATVSPRRSSRISIRPPDRSRAIRRSGRVSARGAARGRRPSTAPAPVPVPPATRAARRRPW